MIVVHFEVSFGFESLTFPSIGVNGGGQSLGISSRSIVVAALFVSEKRVSSKSQGQLRVC